MQIIHHRRKVLILSLCIVLAMALALLLTRDHEPSYRGSPLSKWLVAYERNEMNTPESSEAEQAIRTIGSNAIPYLLKWIRQEPPAWRKAVRRVLPTFVRNSPYLAFAIDGPGDERASGAILAFAIVGTNAASATPQLAAIMNDSTHPASAGRAIIVLSTSGIQALPHLTAALANTNHLYRVRIVVCLRAFMARNIGTNACLPIFTAALNDPDPQVRRAAAQALRQLTNNPAY